MDSATAATPPIPREYWHLWRDPQGISRQSRCQLAPYRLGVLGPNDAPQWNVDLFEQGNSFLTLLPVGWRADWHENHVPKWIFVLSGSWSVQSMDGEIQVFGPGDFSFGGDQDCIATPDGAKGHLSAQVGDTPCLQLILQRNDDAWRNAPPGFFS